ncbi:MAG TPA: translocation/assembly module TamB domain-containing protein [Flavisolibacter sp.]|jgi:hypothetical protein|nr:translocation/assembly module TamB domain-containing protein [Flavisolibacter sp.]
MQKQEETTTVIHKRGWPQRIARIFLKTILFLLLFILLIFLLILTPPVQRFLTVRVENYLEKKLETRVDIGRIGFGLSGNVFLNDVYVEDKTKDTLLSGGTIRANVNFMKLFSNEVEVKDIELQNITAKIKRVLPDTVFNFQFITDAFVADQAKNPDTAQTAPMKLSISDITLDNVSLLYRDAITGMDMSGRIGYATTTIDKMDPYTQTFDFPTLILRNSRLQMKQVKPLLQPKPMSQDIAEAQAPAPLNLSFGVIDISKVAVRYDNDVSALYSNINIGKLKADGRLLDLVNNRVYLDELTLANTTAAIRLGKSQGAEVVKEQAAQEVAAESTAGWDFRVAKVRFDDNDIRYDDDNQPQLSYGMDYAHLKADDLTLHADNFVFKPDSIALNVLNGSFREKSGFVLSNLQGDLLYGAKQTHLKNLLIKTPGSEIKRYAVLQYASLDELTNNFERTVMDIEVVDSYVQVKDILTFAPQLRNQPAFRNPNDVWTMELMGEGTMDRLQIARLQFDGLQDTRVNAAGTLVGLANPQNAGGNFTIYNLHTTRADMEMLAGNSLAGTGINLPQAVDVSGLISGNTGRLNTRLDINTTDGNLDLQGSFANLTAPASLSYDATIRASRLQLGKILGMQGQVGSLTGTVSANGRGVTPDAINTTFEAAIANVGYNRYNYRNIKATGSLRKSAFRINADVNDPNADITLSASGDYAAYGPFRVDADIDSVKLHNLNFSDQHLSFRGEINGTADNINGENLTADLVLTDALLVSGTNRLPIDSLQVIAGHDTEDYIELRSDIASAEIRGEYNMLQMGDIIQNNLAPYFSTATVAPKPVDPYNIRFRAELFLSPALQGFVPDLKEADSVRLQGTLATGEGLDARLSASELVYQTNTVQNLQATINTNDSGLHVNATMSRLKAGGLDVYATTLNATAMQNNIDFSLNIDDKSDKDKYYLSGLVRQSADGNMTLHLRPDSLLLNYDRWQIDPANSITFGTGIQANNFTLSQAGQQLSVQSLGAGADSPLEVRLANFQIGTLTSFLQADSNLVDGVANGTVTFTNLMQQPLFTGNLTIADLAFQRDTVGNLNAQVSSNGSTYTTNVTITGRGNDVALTGNITPRANDMAMNLDLAIRRFSLNTMRGAMKDFITDASGNLYGNVSISGSTSDPNIDGKVNFDNAVITTVAIGGPFRINNESLIIVNNEGFIVDRFSIRDSANNALTFDGRATTTNFANYNFDINIRGRNFMAVNNTKKQNNLFYGKLNISTTLHIGGNETAPVIDGNLSVNEGTNFTVVIPQQDPGVVSREGVVEFVDFSNPSNNDSLLMAPYDSLNRFSLTGFEVATNISVDKDAIFNIVIDEANGDLVNLQGEATLSAGIDPSGKINLTGNYVIDQGSYQLSYNFIQRRFDIEKGSRIEWFGEPTSAEVDMTAIYIANTAPLDLVSDYISAANSTIRNTYLQKLPFQVVLNMDGELMEPEISFDIRLPTDRNYNVSSDIISNVDIRLNQLRQEPSELNKQVFSLLLLGRFVGDNPFESSGEGFSAKSYAMQSVSKLMTEQLNNLAGDLIAGVDLNFDVTSTDDYTTGTRRNRTDLNVGLSKQLLSNRLTVSVGSNFALQGPQSSNQQSSNLAGNVALTYQLSRDGRYLLRAYRRNEYFGVVDGYIVETGLRFIITLDYDKFMNLFRRKQLRVENRDRQNESKQ